MEFELRAYRMEDAPCLAKIANNYNIAKFLTNGFPHPYSLQDAKNFITSVQGDHPVRVFAISINEEVVGSISLIPQDDIHCKNAEMGYFLAEPFWGQGIITKAIGQMVEYGFHTFDLTRIFARPFGTNGASQRVLEKSGFVLEARFKSALYKNGEFVDELVYAIRKGNTALGED